MKWVTVAGEQERQALKQWFFLFPLLSSWGQQVTCLWPGTLSLHFPVQSSLMNTGRELERVVHKSRRERGRRQRWAPTSHFNKLCPWGWKPWYQRAVAKDFIFTNRIFQSLFHYFLKITTHCFINGMKDEFLYNLVFVKLTVQATCLTDSFSSLWVLVASQCKRRISSLKSNFIPQLDFFPSLLSPTVPNPTLEKPLCKCAFLLWNPDPFTLFGWNHWLQS